MMEATHYTSERKELLTYVPKNKKFVLDVGCSSGNFSAMLKRETNCTIHGIEFNEQAAKLAQQKIDQVFIGDALDRLTDIADNQYDLVTMNDVLEHMINPELFLQKLRSKLAKKGEIFAVVPNIRYYKALNHILYDKDFKYEKEGIFDQTHLRFFTKKSILRMFLDCGYEKIEYFGINGSHSLTPWIKNFLTLGAYGEDTRFVQYCFIGRCKQ